LKSGKMLLAVGLVGAVWALAGVPMAAGAAETAPDDLLAEADKLYEAHNYEGALKRLQKIDRAALGIFEKGQYDTLLENTQKAVTAKADDEKAFAEGKEALSNKRYATAIAKLSQAAESPYLEADKAGPAQGLLRLARDGHAEALRQARTLLDQAAADLKVGKTDAARRKARQVGGIDVRLADGDRAALVDLRRRLAAAKAEPAPEKKPAEEKPAAEKKPAEEKPAETKPADEQPAEKQPAEKPEPKKPAALSADQRYARARQMYKAGRYQAAKEALAEINPEELGFFKRWGYGGFVDEVEDAVAGRAAAEKALARGKQALQAKKYHHAVQRLAEAASSDYLRSEDRQEARKAHQQARQAHAEALADAKDLMKQAETALDADDPARAGKLVDRVAAMDVDLGWWTGMSFDRLQRKVASAKTVQVAEAEPSAAPEAEKEPAEEKPPAPAEKPAEKKPAEPEKKSPEPAEKPAEEKPSEEKPAEEKPAPGKRPEGDVAAQARRAHAEDEIKLGREALEQHEYQKARIHFKRALKHWPESKPAQEGLARAETLLAEREEPLIDLERDIDSLERQRIIASVKELVDEARRKMEKAERPEAYTEALRPLATADRTIDVAPVLTVEEQERLREEVHALRKQIKQKRVAKEESRARRAAAEADRRERQRREADRREREQKLDQYWQRAKELRKSMQFGEAIQVLDRLLAVDSTDERARRWREDLLYLEAQQRQVGIRSEREAQIVEALADVEKAAAPTGEERNGKIDYLRYPDAKTWKDLTVFRRKLAESLEESPEVTRTRRRLQERMDLDFEHTSLENVLNYISEVQEGLNIVIDPDISAAGIDLSNRIVDLKVERVPVESVLPLILGRDLGYRVEPGYILITTREKLQQNLPVVTYPVQDLVASIPDFGDQAPRFEAADVIQAATQAAEGGGGGGGDIFGGGAQVAEEEEQAGPDELRALIQRTVNNQSDPNVAAWADEGGSAAVEYMNGLLIITQTTIGHEKISDLLDQLRRERAIMISIESRFCEVTDDFLQDITLDVDVKVPSERFDPAGTAVEDPATGTFDTLPGEVGGAAGDPQVGSPIIVSGTGSNGQGTSTLLDLAGTAFSSTGGWTANEGGLVVSGVFLDDLQVGFLLRAIQADRRSNVLQAPRITLYNGQQSYLSISRVRTYVADLEGMAAGGAGVGGEGAEVYDPTIGAIPVGATLDVKATVSADRRYVQMDLRPQIAELEEMRTYGWGGGAEDIAPAKIDLPEVRVQDFKTTVSVPDGGTLLLGGIREYTEMEAETGVPVLSKVPILKRLFNNRASVRRAHNLLIMIRPKIIIQREKEHELGYDNF